jgi:HEPN domain-containing protein
LTVQFQFLSLEADRASLRPRLRLTVAAKSEHSKRLLLSNVVGICMIMGPGPMLGEYRLGDLVLEQGSTILPVTTPQTQPTPIYLTMDLDQHVTRRIEELRAGRDVRLRITLYVTWLSITEPGWTLSEPLIEAQGVQDRDRTAIIRIPQTDWLKILEGLSYGKIAVFEIETPPPPHDDALAEAIDNLSQARRLFDEGNYEESMVRCRKAIEAAVDKIEPKSGRKLADILGSGSRAEFVRGLRSKMNEFLASAAHPTNEPRVPEPKNREDARLAMLMAYATVAYVASFLSKSSRQ